MTPRTAAYETLLFCEKNSAYSNIAVDTVIKNNDFDRRDASLYTLLVYGTISRKLTLDAIISALSGKNVKRLDTPVLILLRLGIYQIKYCDKVPQSSAVNETVKTASRYASRAKGFINAILRKSCDFNLDFEKYDKTERLSYKYSVSKDICTLLLKQYGEDAEEVLKAFDSPSPVTLCVNTLKISRSELAEKLKDCELGEYSPLSLRLTQKTPISSLDEFKEGLCYVQDEASQIAGEAIDVKPFQSVVDVCSCPGGKSFYTALKMQNNGKILSFDIHESKLSLIESGAKRLGIAIINVKQRDARTPDERLFSHFDRVICDVPCSGIGVIGKKPDLRYKTDEDINSLPPLQLEILNASSLYLKSGGILVYSTCTLNKNENEAVLRDFIKTHPDFELIDFEVGSIKSSGGMLTLLPHIHNIDGFFIAKLIKK